MKNSLYSLFFSLLVVLMHTTINAQNVIHIDSLSQDEFVNVDQHRLSFEDYGDSAVIMLRVLSDNRFVTGLADDSIGHSLFLRSAQSADQDCQKVRLEQVTELDQKSDLNMSIVLDYSGSMFGGNNIYTMQYAANGLMKTVKGAHYTRVNFDGMIDPVNPTPTKQPTNPLYDNKNKYGGSTALYGGIAEAVKTLETTEHNKFAIVFTDGHENSSGMSANTVIDQARRNNTKVIGIAFGAGSDRQRLREICEQTNIDDGLNNVFFVANTLSDVDSLFDYFRNDMFGNYYRVVSECPVKSFSPTELVIKNNETGEETSVKVGNNLAPVVDIEDNVYFGAVTFYNGSYRIKDYNTRKFLMASAENMINHLLANPNDEIILEGHASPDGEEVADYKLSYQRAQEVETFIKNHIANTYKDDADALKAMKRISIEYYGHEKPIYNVTSFLNKDNRRVDFVLKEN